MGHFYRRWAFANGWSESLGLGTTFVLGRAIAPHLEQLQGAVSVVVVAVIAIAAGVLLEGALVGAAQAAVLHRRLPQLPRRDWIRATMIGAGIAWGVGMVPNSLMALQPETAGAAPVEPPALVPYGLALVLGAVTGPILGLAQWTTLRRHVSRAGMWLAANALAWAIGMVLIFSGMDRVPWSGSPLVVAASIFVVCGVTGLAVGAVHGVFLARMTAGQVHAS